MKDFVRLFRSPEGDVYHITLTEDNRALSDDVREALGNIRVTGIDLRRLEGSHVTGHKVLDAVADAIAEYFLKNEDIIICYYCDFLNPIPNTRKNSMPPQEYRSRLFDKMFQRYVKLHHINNVRLSVVEINGINEKYYFHVIYRENHSILASIIGSDIKEGYDK